MDAFGYTSVIFSVVIGLGMSSLLSGVVELIKARRRITFYWIHLVWVVLTFVSHIFLWWTMWNLRFVKEWHFFSFLLLLLPPILMFTAASFLIPKLEPQEELSLRDYFYENTAPFFLVNAAFTLVMGVENWVLTGHMSPPRVALMLALWFVLLVVSAFVKRPRFHAVVALLFVLLFLLFILMFGLKLK